MNIRRKIEELFSAYEKTPSLSEFMEEMESKLNDRVESLKRKGLNDQTAADRALAELGDVSSLADELSLKKKQEVFSEMYMKTRNYLTPKRSALYALCSVALGASILIPLIIWFNTGFIGASVSSVLPFGMASVLGCLYLGLTQETAAREPAPPKRAALYVLAAGLILLGAYTALMVYNTGLAANGETSRGVFLTGAVASALAFSLPGAAIGIFLALTEKDRKKPWMRKLIEESRANDPFSDPAIATRFGLFCGALWISAAAVFTALTLAVGIKFSWLSFAAALVIQMLIMAAFMKENK